MSLVCGETASSTQVRDDGVHGLDWKRMKTQTLNDCDDACMLMTGRHAHCGLWAEPEAHPKPDGETSQMDGEAVKRGLMSQSKNQSWNCLSIK